VLRYAEIAFSGLMVLVFAFAIFEARDWSPENRLYPYVIAIPILALAAVQLGLDVRRRAKGAAARDASNSEERIADGATGPEIPPETVIRRTRTIVVWIALSFVLLWVVGFREGIPLFVFLYLRVSAKEGWLLSSLISLGVWAMLTFFFGDILHLPWPQPQLAHWFGFRWPSL
jgi:hypothetical protein